MIPYPDNPTGGCAVAPVTDGLTRIISHEVAETVVDRPVHRRSRLTIA